MLENKNRAAMKKHYYKLSVWNSDLGAYIVHQVCLTKRKAERLRDDYITLGVPAKISPQV